MLLHIISGHMHKHRHNDGNNEPKCVRFLSSNHQQREIEIDRGKMPQKIKQNYT